MAFNMSKFSDAVLDKINTSKKDPIRDKFIFLRENYSPVNISKYMTEIKSLPTEDILKNSMYIFSESSMGAEFFNFFMKVHKFNRDILTEQKANMDDYLSKCKDNKYDKYSNEKHFEELTKTFDMINEDIAQYADLGYMREQMLSNYHFNKIFDLVSESSINNELDKIVNNIQHNPEYMNKYKSLISDLKTEKIKNFVKYLPLLLVKNTSIFLGLIGMGIGVTLTALSVFITICLSVPQFIVAKLIDGSVERSKAVSYSAVIDNQISILRMELSKETEFEKKKYIQKFIDIMVDSKNTLEDYIKLKHPVKEAYAVMEVGVLSILSPALYILPIPKKWLRAFMKTGWDVKEQVLIGDINKMKDIKKVNKLITNMYESKRFYETIQHSNTVEAKVIKYGIFNGVNATNAVGSIIEFHIMTIDLLKKRRDKLSSKRPVHESISDIIEKGLLGFGEDIDMDEQLQDEIEDDDDEDANLLFSEEIDPDVEGLNESWVFNLYDDSLYNYLDNSSTNARNAIHNELAESTCSFIFDEENTMESFNRMLRAGNALNIIDEAASTRKVAHTLRDTKKVSDKVATNVSKAIEPVNNFVSELIDSVKKVDSNERRNRIIEGKFRFRLLKVIRDAILISAAWMITPALAAIGFIAKVALDKHADRKIRDQILRELKEEQKIVEEKIDDAKSDSQRQKKYELMRIKMRLDKEIERIEYKLDHS